MLPSQIGVVCGPLILLNGSDPYLSPFQVNLDLPNDLKKSGKKSKRAGIEMTDSFDEEPFDEGDAEWRDDQSRSGTRINPVRLNPDTIPHTSMFIPTQTPQC